MNIVVEFMRFIFAGSLPQGAEHVMKAKVFFILTSALMGMLVLLTDYAYFKLKGRNTSLLRLTAVYIGPVGKRFFAVILWIFTSAVVALLGDIFGILQASRQSALLVAISWPLIFQRIVERGEEKGARGA